MPDNRSHVRKQLETLHARLAPQVRGAVYRDVHYIARRLRPADELDLEGASPRDALLAGFSQSVRPLTVIDAGRPIAMFGVVPWGDESGVGSVWLLGTPQVERIKVPFLRQSHQWLEHISEGFAGLRNKVHQDNDLHVRWLRWLGFVFIRQHNQFLEFAKCVNPYRCRSSWPLLQRPSKAGTSCKRRKPTGSHGLGIN